ncbi:MAG: shikimate dehydrogenase, partial [Bacteroidota bacterium]
MNYSIEKLSKHDNLLGLIGYPLSHSFSKGYFAKKFKEEDIPGWFYESFPLTEARHFKQLFERLPNLRGINVTLPYKEQVIPFLDELEKGAAEIGAVNTIKRVGDRLLGFNTDVYGFQQSLVEKMNESGLTFKGALILGTGGAAKAV